MTARQGALPTPTPDRDSSGGGPVQQSAHVDHIQPGAPAVRFNCLQGSEAQTDINTHVTVRSARCQLPLLDKDSKKIDGSRGHSLRRERGRENKLGEKGVKGVYCHEEDSRRKTKEVRGIRR